ncbi:MAG TPA: lipoyl(octanoyl) transferase LipB [Anaerolineales bacterium]
MHGNVIDLGLIDYQQAWDLQQAYAAEIASGQRAPTLLLLEHPHVYTFGRRGHAENLLFAQPELKERGIAVHWVDRGGDVTYHGPGQLVGYPLLPLGRPQPAEQARDENQVRLPEADYVGYIRKLEKVLIAVLARFGLAAGQRPGLTGVWIQPDVASRCARCRPEDRLQPAKIAAIGVKVDARGVSRHGFALNVNPDMSYWDGIIACGLAGAPIVSMADLLPEPPAMRDVKNAVTEAFVEFFDWHID